MDILERVKTARRISHNKLDEEILEHIEACKLELERVHIDKYFIDNPDALVRQAIVQYCLSFIAETSDLQKAYRECFEQMIEQLRKSSRYSEKEDV